MSAVRWDLYIDHKREDHVVRSSIRCVRTASVLGALVLSLGAMTQYVPSAQAYEILTHTRITDVAIAASTMDTTLRRQYRMDGGVASLVQGDELRAFIVDGSAREDSPAFRVLNHFHNPLTSWSQAGLLDLGQSSIYWQQNPNQGASGGGGTWSWPLARQRFRAALTASTPEERDAALADTARALGQIVHLIQDATVPAHTRNDAHLVILDGDGYEGRLDEMRASQNPEVHGHFLALLARPPVRPAASIFTPTEDFDAPAPVARLIDTDIYAGSAATYRAGSVLGVAEYTNGGYVSDDTIFLEFPLPRRDSLDAIGFLEPDPELGVRRYFSKTTDGDSVSHFVAEGTLWERLRFRGQVFGCQACYVLDDRTYEAAAGNLIPRAVGYSAALLDYFFRGQLKVTFAGSPRVVRIVNTTPGEAMSGQVTFYYDTRAGERVKLAGPFLVSLAPDRSSDPFTLPSPSADNPPDDSRVLVVFEGTLGDERDTAIAAAFAEPPAWVQVVSASIGGSSGSGIVGGYIPAGTDLAEGPITIEAFHSQNAGDCYFGVENFVDTLIYRSNAAFPGTTMRVTISVDNADADIGYVVLAAGALSSNATLGEAEHWQFDGSSPGGTVVGNSALLVTTTGGTYDIPVGSIEFFRFMGNAHYPPCPPGGVYSVRGVMLHLEFL